MASEIDDVFELPERAMPDFLARIAKLSKKSMEILGKPITAVVQGEVLREVTVNGKKFDAEGNRYVETFYTLSVKAETPKIAGYTFIGTIDHTVGDNNLLRGVPGGEPIPARFRSAEPFCDHCSVRRRRNETFVLRCDADGSFTQIGRQCIRDFIGYDVSSFVETAKWLSQMEPSDDDGERGYEARGSNRNIRLVGYLAHVHAMIRNFGWVSRSEAKMRDEASSTASDALSNMFPTRGYAHLAKPLTDKDKRIAEEALTWARALKGKSDYEYNLSVVASLDYISYKETGIAASMITGYFRHLEQEVNRAKRADSLKGSVHLGALGERLSNIEAQVYWYRCFPGMFGARHGFRLRTPDNNIVVWWASSEKDLEIGDKVLLTGRITKHDVYEGVNQTVVTRCKFVMVEKKNPVEAA